MPVDYIDTIQIILVVINLADDNKNGQEKIAWFKGPLRWPV